MFRRRRQPGRQELWQQLAAELDLEQCNNAGELLADRLDLDSTPLAGAVYQAANTGGLKVFAFDFLSDVRVPGQPVLSAACLIDSDREFCPVPLRMDRQLRSQLAGIRAGASRAQVILTGNYDFDERVTVVARDSNRAAGLLTPGVRQAALRILERGEHAPTITANRRQLLAQVQADRFELSDLQFLLTDLMALQVALAAASR